MRFRCASCAHLMDSELLAPTCERCRGALLMEGGGRPLAPRGELESLPAGVWR